MTKKSRQENFNIMRTKIVFYGKTKVLRPESASLRTLRFNTADPLKISFLKSCFGLKKSIFSALLVVCKECLQRTR